MAGSKNTILRHFFGATAPESTDRFDLSGRSRSRRVREIFSIVRKYHPLRGFTPVEFRAALEELGPSFVKIGQTLSTRSEILPREFCEELSKLQTESDPLPFDQILAQLDRVYAGRFFDYFESIDPKPLGSASLAQVHRAKLKDGGIVAVKIQRPGVKDVMAQDIDIMRSMARHASHFMKDEQMLDMRDVVEEMWNTFLEETDFVREAENLQLFKRLNADVAFIDCPEVHPELCNEFTLVMEYIEGIPIYDRAALLSADYDLGEIGRKLLDNYATQILEHGFFHADPHPGNLIIRGGKIVYIDLGIMGRLSPAQRAGFGRIIRAVGVGSSAELKDALLSFAVAKDNAIIDHTRFLADLDLLLENYGSCDVADLDIGLFLSDIFSLTRMSKVTLPTVITSVSRGIVTIEGTVADFIANDNVINIINAHIARTQDPFLQIKDSIEEAALALKGAAEGLAEAAQYSGETLRMLTRGQLKINMEVLGSEAPLRTVSKIVNRLTIGVVIAGLFVGSSLLAPYGLDPRILGVPLLSFFGYAGAMVLSIWVVVDIWRRR